MLDILIKNGTIIDGTGRPRYIANIGIKAGKLEFIGNRYEGEAKEVINADGLVITPGFIDFHSHSDYYSLLIETRAMNMLKQGITTEVTGHCGLSVFPLIDETLKEIKPNTTDEKYKELTKIPKDAKGIINYIEKSQLGTNIALMVGHGTIRTKVMGYESRRPNHSELMEMKDLVREAMEAGALGMTTGLLYPPGVYAEEDELVELSKIVSEYGGIYASHMRSEGSFVVRSVEETIRIGENAKLPVVVSHHKITGKQNWGKSKETLSLIDEANKKGIKVRLDQYPYKASCTTLISVIPPQFAVEGQDRLIEKLKDRNVRNEIKRQIENSKVDFENLIQDSGFDGILIVAAPATKEMCGKTIVQISEQLRKDPFDVIFDLIIENNGRVFAAYSEMEDEDVERILAYKYTMGGTDASGLNERITAMHPRDTGTFIKILSEYIRDKKVVTLEEGIRKITSMPADMAGFKTKGIIREGYDADLVILDYINLKADADFVNPSAPNRGVKYVVVNGEIAVKDDNVTGVCAGKIIK